MGVSPWSVIWAALRAGRNWNRRLRRFRRFGRNPFSFRHPNLCSIRIVAAAERNPFACNHLWNLCNLRFASYLPEARKLTNIFRACYDGRRSAYSQYSVKNTVKSIAELLSVWREKRLPKLSMWLNSLLLWSSLDRVLASLSTIPILLIFLPFPKRKTRRFRRSLFCTTGTGSRDWSRWPIFRK